MNLISNNPFRILGLPLTASERQITKQITTLSTYLEMGKSKSFDTDYGFLPPVQRTNSTIREAQKKIEQTESKFLYSLFWFWFNNAADELATDFLKEGNYSKAIDLWEKLVFAQRKNSYKAITVNKNLISDSDLWSEDNTEDYQFVKNGDAYIVERKKESSYSIPCVYTDIKSDNWIIECECIWDCGVDNMSHGIVFGRTGGSYYFLGIAANGYYQFSKFEDWVFKNCIDWTFSSVIKRKGNNFVKIEKVETNLNFYINGRLVNSYFAEPFFGNYFGFKVSGNQTIVFKNFHFSKLVQDVEILKGFTKEVLITNLITKFKNSDTESYSFTVDNGNINLEKKTDGSFFTCQELKTDSSKDLIIQVESNWLDGVQNTLYGIIWGKSKEENNFFTFGISKNGYAYIEKFINWESQNVLGWKKIDCLNASGVNLLTIRKIKKIYFFYVNETLIYEMPFEPFFGNHFGFLINGIQKVSFAQFQIGYLNPNPDYGKGIIVTAKTSSNIKNLSILYLAVSNNSYKLNHEYLTRGVSLAGVLFSSDYMKEYCKKIGGSNIIYNPEKAQRFFINEIFDFVKDRLDDVNGIRTSTLIQSFSGFPSDGKQIVLNTFLSQRIELIEKEIEVASSKRKVNPGNSLQTGFTLMRNTKDEILVLKSSLGEDDLQYGVVADKLSYEIVQCAIDYFNYTKDDSSSLPLYEFGAAIAFSDRIKDRANENLNSCKEWIAEKPKREAIDNIYDQLTIALNQLNNKNTPSALSHDIFLQSTSKELITNTSGRLSILRGILGRHNEEYIKISNEVVVVALACIIAYHNSHPAPDFSSSISMLNTLESLDMEKETLERLRANKVIIENNRSIKYSIPSPPSSGSSNCYIATMVYGSSESNEVLILRKYRDDVLKKYWIGRNFIYHYYKYSPLLVRCLNNNRKVNSVIKKILDFIIKIIQK